MSERIEEREIAAEAPTRGRWSPLAFAGFGVAFAFGFVGIFLSIAALRRIRESGGSLRGRGFAVAGVWVSIGSMIQWILSILFVVLSLRAAPGWPPPDPTWPPPDPYPYLEE